MLRPWTELIHPEWYCIFQQCHYISSGEISYDFKIIASIGMKCMCTGASWLYCIIWITLTTQFNVECSAFIIGLGTRHFWILFAEEYWNYHLNAPRWSHILTQHTFPGHTHTHHVHDDWTVHINCNRYFVCWINTPMNIFNKHFYQMTTVSFNNFFPNEISSHFRKGWAWKNTEDVLTRGI